MDLAQLPAAPSGDPAVRRPLLLGREGWPARADGGASDAFWRDAGTRLARDHDPPTPGLRAVAHAAPRVRAIGYKQV